MVTPTQIAAYLTLFVVVGFLFLLVNLLVGKLVRPKEPSPEKLDIYECGEPTIGSSFVQFDLRFYVVALVFIVFDAEVAFLFPAATVFGKQTQLGDRNLTLVEEAEGGVALTPAARGVFDELMIAAPSVEAGTSAAAAEESLRGDVRKFTWYVYAATLFFFMVLFVGFAYEWKTGAFDWVRAVKQERSRASPPPPAAVEQSEPILS